jgi:hypothetical protein
MNSIPS